MCRAAPDNLPYHAFQEHAETLTVETPQDIRHLARINMKGCRYQQLALTNSQFLRVLRKNAESASHEFEVEPEYIQEAQQRLHEFASDRGSAYAGIRFLSMR